MILNHTSCAGCFWQDQCESDGACEYYTPLHEDREIERMIEEKRYENREEFEEYLCDRSDSFSDF